MATEKFLCRKCVTVCMLSVSFNQGDDKTKTSLVCPLQLGHHAFEIVDKSPERAEIHTDYSPEIKKQIEIIQKKNDQLLYLKHMIKDCSKCVNASNDQYCFNQCKGFDKYSEAVERIMQPQPSLEVKK